MDQDTKQLDRTSETKNTLLKARRPWHSLIITRIELKKTLLAVGSANDGTSTASF